MTRNENDIPVNDFHEYGLHYKPSHEGVIDRSSLGRVPFNVHRVFL